MKPIIKVENISKQYRLGIIGTGTLSNDLKRWWYNVRGKEDPFLKVGETNDRAHKGSSEYVWAIKDINMEIMPGDVVGIIGKNGAGKSTLLKILSKVTGPTTGSIKYDGRIGSLLEVGTGFHPELTGRENIFLNGAILGMTKREIRSKLDEIIDFSGVERYIDTPVKRYSSGMMVRLGFAVAAHLEPEILVVDEVLAVGDAEFQKKAIGKMQDVSKQDGRTVLFVSHNMGAVKNLCKSGVLLENGMVKYTSDNIQEVVSQYVIGGGGEFIKTKSWEINKARGNEKVKLTKVGWNTDNNSIIDTVTDFYIDIEFYTFIDFEKFNLSITLKTLDDVTVSALVSNYVTIRKGIHTARLFIPGRFMNNLAYKLDIYFVEKEQAVCFLDNIFNFEVVDNREGMEWYGHWIGCVRPDFKFSIL